MKINYVAWPLDRLEKAKKNLVDDIKSGKLSAREKGATRSEISRIEKAIKNIKSNK